MSQASVAARKQDAGELRALLLAGASVEEQDWGSGLRLLFTAAEWGSLDGVAALIEAGASVNALSGPQGRSALSVAAEAGEFEICEALIAAGALPLADRGGSAPLHYAAGDGNARLVRLLLEAGHDPQALDKEGLSAADWADQTWGGDGKGCALLLRQAMAEREGLLIGAALGAGSPRRPPGRI